LEPKKSQYLHNINNKDLISSSKKKKEKGLFDEKIDGDKISK